MKRCVPSNVHVVFPLLDGGDWPEPPGESQESPILLSRRVTVYSGGVDSTSSGGSPICMRVSTGGTDVSCSPRASSADAAGLSDSSDREESLIDIDYHYTIDIVYHYTFLSIFFFYRH